MQDTHCASHRPLSRDLLLLPLAGYLALAGGGLLAAWEHSMGLLVALAVVAGFVLALRQRIERLEGRESGPAPLSSDLALGDGGSFPGARPSSGPAPASRVVVIDGGSLERYRG